MSAIDLQTLLKLVGKLDDSQDPNSASTRFRAYLQENVLSVGDLRTYVETALSISGDQYNKALQDLINHAGQLLGFDAQFGRYRGVRGKIGFDGLWQSPTGRALVVEVKTTDVYTVKTATLLGYINALVSDGQLDKSDHAIGLYVYGRFDTATSSLENAILVESRQDRLRVVSVDALLNLLELQQEYDLDHATAFQLLLPSPVRLDPIINLIFDITSQERRAAVEEMPRTTIDDEPPALDQPVNYYLLPAADSEDGLPVIQNLHHWLDRGMWGLGQRTGYRTSFQPGDKLCFYAARIGVVVEATADSACFDLDSRESPKPQLDIPYAIRLRDVRWFEDEPVVLTPEVRGQLTAFQDRDLKKGWAWFVQGTSKLTQKDFDLLTGRIQTDQPSAPAPGKAPRRGPPAKLLSIPQDYKGQTVKAIRFQGKRYETHTWKDAMLTLFEILRSQDQTAFEQAALTLKGRKRPYITPDPKELRASQPIPKTTLHVETNLSSNMIAKLCYTLIIKLDYDMTALTLETEQ